MHSLHKAISHNHTIMNDINVYDKFIYFNNDYLH